MDSYSDIPIKVIDLLGNDVDNWFYFQDVKERKLYLCSEISSDTVFDTVHHILRYNAEDKGLDPEKRKPIIIYIATPGGDVDAGFQLIDAIESSKTPVFTVNLGWAYSMGFWIFLAGSKRFATKNAKFLMHDGVEMILDSAAKARDRMDFNSKLEERIKAYTLSRTNISSEEYDSHHRVEWYMFADEAKNYGIVNKIIDEDCDIDEVV